MKTGFTLIEVIIASTIFVIIMGTALSFSGTFGNQVNSETRIAGLMADASYVLNKLDSDLCFTKAIYTGYEESTTTEIPENDGIIINSDSIEFRRYLYFNIADSKDVWSKPMKYQLVPSHGEIAGDGIDNNHNGYIDELCIQRDNGDGTTEYLRTDLLFADPADFSFALNGNLINLHMAYIISSPNKPLEKKIIDISFSLL